MSRGYLVEVKKHYWHPFPEESMPQDQNIGPLKSADLLYVKYLYQKDGSRFKCIYTKRFSGPDIAHRLSLMAEDREAPAVEKMCDAEMLLENIRSEIISPLTHEYVAYKTHQFLNGCRYTPLIKSKKSTVFYHASCLFPLLRPEDDFGVLAEKEQDLALPVIGWSPVIINYQSYVRLCACCGVVSDISKPKSNPWLSKKHV